MSNHEGNTNSAEISPMPCGCGADLDLDHPVCVCGAALIRFHSIHAIGPVTVFADQLLEIADYAERLSAGPFMYMAKSRNADYSDPDLRELLRRLRDAGGTITEF